MRRLPVLAVVIALLALPAAARADTDCAAGAPGPGYRILRLDLPEGSSFFTMQVRSARTARPTDGPSSWHQAIGLYVIRASDMSLVAFKFQNIGSAPRRAIVDADGMRVAAMDTSGPEVSIAHSKQSLASSLQPGTYYAVIVSSDGGDAAPNDGWFVDIGLSGVHACADVGSGDIVDADQSRFSGGTQVYANGVGTASGISYAMPSARAWFVGALDAQTAAGGDATLGYTFADGTAGSVTDGIVPFVARGGDSAYTASYSGAYPLVAIEGLAFDLS